jgi:hypothetical protein
MVFELGLFIGSLGRERNFVTVPRGTADLRPPNDRSGLVTLSYDTTPSRNEYEAALGPASHSIRTALSQLVTADLPGGDSRHACGVVLYRSAAGANLIDFIALGESLLWGNTERPKGERILAMNSW